MNSLYEKFKIPNDLINLSNIVEKELTKEYEKIDNICEYNSLKVLNAFQNNNLSEVHFSTTTGYGYGDIGRDTIEKIYAQVLGTEDALVRNQFISGSHALTVALFAFLRPGDTLLSITGKPYDTLDEVIGIVDNPSSLKSFGVNYEQVDLLDNEFDVETIKKILLSKKIKLIEIQRSKGYSTRKSLTIDKVENIILEIRKIDSNVIIMIDNCYCEFVTEKEPSEIGADVIVGSLIKNLGGGIVPNGAYVAGRKNLIALAADRLTVPGEGKEVGPSLGANRLILQGLFMSPSVVSSALKTAVFTSLILSKLGYKVEPAYNESRADIVQNIEFGDKDKLIKYCQGIQMGSPIDSNAIPTPWDMPGYTDQVIMAAGTFTQGSSIEISCDGPIRKPYIAYQQGGLTYQYGKLAVLKAIQQLISLDK